MTTPTTLTVLTGASRGLGAALADALLVPGAQLLCLSRRRHPGLEARAAAQGAQLTQWAVDLAEPRPVAEALAGWLAERGPADGYAGPVEVRLINNAAALGRIGPVDGDELAALAQALRVGLEAPLLLSAAFVRATQGWPARRRILNISSGLGRRAMAGSATYCAIKAGLDHLSRAMALDEARRPNGARIVSLAPGVIDTDMQQQLRSADARGFPDQGRFLAMKSSGQLASPAEAARQVLQYLARPDFGDEVVADVRG